jgi:hypothetical protein
MAARTLVAAALAVLVSVPVHAQRVQPDFWGPGGEVTSIARVGNTIYLAGGFADVGPATGGAVPLDRIAGAPLPRFPRVNGIVAAVIGDGRGGWFVGGDFTAVEGRPHHNVAHLRADGTVDPWDPGVADVDYAITSSTINPVYTVAAMALAGDVLYIGGRFETVGDEPRCGLVAVDTRSGAVLPWVPAANGLVTALAIDGGTLFVGGSFSTLAGQPRSCLGAFRLEDGSLAAWNPTADRTVRAIAPTRDVVWVGGEFDHVGGQLRNSLAAVTRDSGVVTAWNAGLMPRRAYIAHGDYVWPSVSSIAVGERTLFVGGCFDSAGGAARWGLAELDPVTARATAFDVHMDGGSAKTLALRDQILYVGGYLYGVGGGARPNLAAVDIRTGLVTPWNPRAQGITLAVAVEGNTVMAGGEFTSMRDWQPRAGLAALDATSGRLRSWNPTLDMPYGVTLATDGERLYVAGQFTQVDGQPRGHFAAFDGASGELLDWNPWTTGITSFDASLVRMATIGSTLYVTAPVNSINGLARRYLFAFDGRTGELLPWVPNPKVARYSYKSGRVDALSAFGNTLFVAGEFDSLGGASRPYLAEVDATRGLATAWTPDVAWLGNPGYFYPRSILSNDATTFVGAWLAAPPERWGMLALDRSGAVLDWTPALVPDKDYLIVGDQPVANALALHDGTLFVGGRFDTVATTPRANLVALDASTGALRPWDPDTRGGFYHPFDIVDVLCLTGDDLYVGGRLTRLGGYPVRNFAALVLPAGPSGRQGPDLPRSPGGPTLTLTPNPVRGRVRFTLGLSAPAMVSLGVYDVAGRRVAAVLDHRRMEAGTQTLPLDTTHLRAGIYYCRLDDGNAPVTRRIVVLD